MFKVKKDKILVLPVEIQNRELEAKLNLAFKAVERDFRVIIGDQKIITRNIHKIKRGFYLDKSVALTKKKFFSLLKCLGFKVYALCEEGLVYRNKEKYLTERVSLESLLLVENFFCWGVQQRDDILTKSDASKKLVVAGNPRFDLLKPHFTQLWEKKARNFATKYNDYVLINTNFSRFNKIDHMPDVVEILSRRGTINLKNKQDIDYYVGLVNHLETLFHEFIQLIDFLANELKSYNIVIRPHPSENIKPYTFLAKKYENVFIEDKGNIVPLIMASGTVIHNSCTTGLESAILGKNVLSYMPTQNEKYDSYLPNAVSTKFASKHQSIGLINSEKKPVHTNAIHDFVDLRNSKSSSDIIINTMLSNPYDFKFSFKEFFARLVLKTVRFAASLIREFYRPTDKIKMNKFNGVSLETIQEIIYDLNRIHNKGALNRIVVKNYKNLQNVFILDKEKIKK